MRILIVEDNDRLADLIGRGLADHGFVPDLVTSLRDASHALQGAGFDAIILDLGLPDGDALAWLGRERSRAGFPPVLILTARDALEDRVSGLDAGADDYLIKPVETAELAARLRALLRRPGNRSAPVIRIGNLQFDTASRVARRDDAVIELSRRETDLLELLMRRAGAVVRRSAIADALYHFDEPVTPNAIEAIVSRLRQKLGSAGTEDALITIRGMGYMLKDQAR
jgi:two-component system, OmpR family, response regulator QseB